jgi:BACON domain-containing protein
VHAGHLGFGSAIVRIYLSVGMLFSAATVATCDKNPVQPFGLCASIAESQRSITQSPDAGHVTLAVTAAINCSWSAAMSGDFLSLASGATGSGNGVVVLNVSENAGAERIGSVAVGSTVATIRQAAGVPCAFGVSPLQLSFPSDGADRTIDVSLTQGRTCPWTATSSDSFLTVSQGATGIGSGQARITAELNAYVSRVGHVVVAGRTIEVSQDGACRFDLFGPHTFSVPADASIVLVTLFGDPWTCVARATSNSSFIQLRLRHVEFDQADVIVDANSGAARTGTATVGGKTITINQAGR